MSSNALESAMASATGFSAVVLAKVYDIIPIVEVYQAFLLGLAGALGGLVIKEVWVFTKKKIEKNKKKL